MYKIAILFYGHLRSFKSTFPYFKENILEANRDCEIDIFIHTWDELEHPAPRRQYKKDLEVAGKKIQKEDIDFINAHYCPAGLKITPQIHFTQEQKQQIIQNGFKEENYYAILNVSYSMEQVCALKEQAKKDYDFVILTRFDIIFYQKLNLSPALDRREQGIKYAQFTSEDFNSSIFYAYMEKDLYPELLRNQRNYITGIDLFCAGSNSAMDKILKWHNEILSLPPMGIEYWLTKKVVDNGLIPQIIYYDKPRCFHILRTNDVGFKRAGGGGVFDERMYPLAKTPLELERHQKSL